MLEPLHILEGKQANPVWLSLVDYPLLMRKYIPISFVLSFVLLGFSIAQLSPADAAVKVGGTCSKINTEKRLGDKTLSCIKSGKKMVWKLSEEIINDSFRFTNLCEPDPKVPIEWKSFQDFGVRNRGCNYAYRYVPGLTKFTKPTTAESDPSALLPTSNCKLTNAGNNSHARRGFPMLDTFIPSKSAVIQILGVSFSDFSDLSDPTIDHAKEIKLFTDALINSSDVPINPIVRNVNKYIQLPEKVEDYRLYEHLGNVDNFGRAVVNAWDSSIDFSDVDYVLIFAPERLNIQQFNRAINFNSFRTAEKNIRAVMVAGPLHSDGTNRNSQYIGNTQDQSLMTMPMTLIHEGIYHMMGLDDHLGNEKYLDPRIPNPADWNELGTGMWGNMSGLNGDLLLWDKWTIGFIADSQVRCVDPTKTSTHWLRPSSSKGIFEKLIVIPISNTKGIVIESRRSTGYNYKYPLSTEGALVYTVDTQDQRFNYGVYVKRPSNRSDNRFGNGFSLGDAALKKNESIILDGFKISVLESSASGDVIRIEKS